MIIEDNGVPRFVQQIWYDYHPYYFRVRYFDGSTTSIDASYVVQDLSQREPTLLHYVKAMNIAKARWQFKNCS